MLNIFVFNIKFRQIEINIKQKECKRFYDKNKKEQSIKKYCSNCKMSNHNTNMCYRKGRSNENSKESTVCCTYCCHAGG